MRRARRFRDGWPEVPWMVRWAAVPKRKRVNIGLYVVAALSGVGLTAEIVLGGSPPVSTELAIGAAPAPQVRVEGLGPTETPFEPLPPLDLAPAAPSPLGGLRITPVPRPRSSGPAPKAPKPESRFQPVADRQPVELNTDDPKPDDPKPNDQKPNDQKPNDPKPNDPKPDDPKPDPTTTTRPPTTTTPTTRPPTTTTPTTRPPTTTTPPTTTPPTTRPPTTTTPTTRLPTTTTPTTKAPTTTTPTTRPPTTTTPTTAAATSTTAATTTTSPTSSGNPFPPGFFGGGRRPR